jgi:hypothetical protein
VKFSVMFSVVVPPGGGSTGYVRTLGECEAGQSRRRALQRLAAATRTRLPSPSKYAVGGRRECQ